MAPYYHLISYPTIEREEFSKFIDAEPTSARFSIVNFKEKPLPLAFRIGVLTKPEGVFGRTLSQHLIEVSTLEFAVKT